MSQFIPAVPSECLPGETPGELVQRICRRHGVRPWLSKRRGDMVEVYSRDDPALSEDQREAIARSARQTVLVALASGELNSFVQSSSSGNYYRIPASYWSKIAFDGEPVEAAGAWGIRPDGTTVGVTKHPDPSYFTRLQTYRACSTVDGGQAEFEGRPILTALSDGDALVGDMPPRPSVTTALVYTQRQVANENAGDDEKIASVHNGCPGPPTAMPFCEIIMRERSEAGLTMGKLTEEARAVIAAFKQDRRFNHIPPPGQKAITNSLTLLYAQLTGKAQFPRLERED